MPFCAQPGCPTIVPRGRCGEHARLEEHARPNRDVRKWYHTRRWERLRRVVLVDSGFQCQDATCRQVTLDLDVDHIRPHGGDPGLFWSRANLQALCTSCHSRKTKRGE